MVVQVLLVSKVQLKWTSKLLKRCMYCTLYIHVHVYVYTVHVYVYTLNKGLFYIGGREWVTVPVFPHFALNVESQKHGEVHIRLC